MVFNTLKVACVLKRTKLKDRILPGYSMGEEIANMVTHILGGAFGITATVLCVVFAAKHHNTWGVVSGSIYGASMIILYTMSSIYHGLSPRLTGKKVMQILDHCCVFLLIAGTYTPIALSAVRPLYPALGWVIFGIIWALAALGITLNAIDLKSFKKFSMITYLGMGWLVVFTLPQVIRSITFNGFLLLLSGGIAYTIGAVLYMVGKKKHIKFIHSVFHVFVFGGSLLQFFCILLYVM